MPTIIPVDTWEPAPDKPEAGFGPTHGQTLTTEKILASLDEVDSRPEMRLLDELMMTSPSYLKRKNLDQPKSPKRKGGQMSARLI